MSSVNIMTEYEVASHAVSQEELKSVSYWYVYSKKAKAGDYE